MNILYIGKFEKYFRTENYVTHALQQLGHKVHKMPVDSIDDLKGLKRTTIGWDINLVLFSKASQPFFKDYIEFCRVEGITTATWVFDLFWNFPGSRVMPPQMYHSDYVFTTDGGNQYYWDKYGINHKVLRQGIHLPDAYTRPTDYKYEIAFIGNLMKIPAYMERRILIEYLRETYGKRVYETNNTRGKDLNTLLSRTKLVVGQSIPSDYYWSNRIYEILGRGGFLLHPFTRGLEDEFEEGVHYVGYDRHDLTDLKDKIDYYLEHTEEQEKIRAAGHQLVKEKYTYEKRCQEMLSQIVVPVGT